MTLVRALLMLSAIIISVQSFPSTTRDYEKESMPELVIKETEDPSSTHTATPQAMLGINTDSERESSTVEFVFKSPKEGLSVQKGSNREKYTISNLPPKNQDEKLNPLESNKENEIDTYQKDELHKLNITGISKTVDLLSEAQIKRDRWLFGPQEMSAITGGLPKYFYDAETPIRPFPELSDTVKDSAVSSKKENINFQVPATLKSNKPPETGGPMLYPQSVFSREIDIPFYF